jgi:CRP-like cAMP-binding protein
MTDELLPTLRSLHLLQEFPDELLLQLSTISRIEEFQAGAVVFRQGDTASTIYFVAEGNVSLEICASGVGCRRILTVAPGELLGWSPVLAQERMTATARALSATKVIAVDALQIRAICEQDPQFGYEFMKLAATAIAQRLNATRLQLLDVYGGQMGGAPAIETGATAGAR